MMKVYFSDFFEVTPKKVERYGAFNISLLSDLPLFVDPFLLFNSRRPQYRQLHAAIIQYLRFLKTKSASQQLDPGLLRAWYRFPEVKQNWFGFTGSSNKGSGLGQTFADALHSNLNRIFADFGTEKITKGSHLEKLCLIREGVGRDNISDFTTNLIHEFLLGYTEKFAQEYIQPKHRRRRAVGRVHFNYATETWEPREYDLPLFQGDYVLLTPRDILTRDDTWINKVDLVNDFDQIPESIPNDALRAQINNYFLKILPKKATAKEKHEAEFRTIQQFPALIDYYIKFKEEHGGEAQNISSKRVAFSQQLYVEQFRDLIGLLRSQTQFYGISGNTYQEAHQRLAYFKDVIENKGGHRFFWINREPLHREDDVHILYRMTWCATETDVSTEVNDGRGPADFKISKGKDKSIVEFKLAKNKSLERNLEKQTEIYERASDAQHGIKAIVYFTKEELGKVQRILKKLKLTDNRDVVLIDARRDNKPSGSKA
jgi:hypothetical protein